VAAFDLRSLDVPIVQAGMGGVAWHELAEAVSEAVRRRQRRPHCRGAPGG
jgi:O-acetyl-ADP-ribose deacetylase (regulator of RNase III)